MKLIYIIVAFLFLVSIASAQENFMVSSISFVGNKSFSDDELRGIMLTKESPAAFFRFTYKIIHLGGPAVYLDPFVLKADLQRIKQYYFNNGFFFAHADSSLKYDSEDGTVDILIKINEGTPAYVNSLRYHGVSDSTKNFMELLHEKPILKNGDRYSAKRVDGEVGHVLGLLQDDGYTYAKKDSSVVTVTDSNSDSVHAAVDLYFDSGRRYLWGDLSVLSLDSSKASFERHIVLREMLFKPGDVYSFSKKTESEQRLYSLNLFEAARIATPEKPPANDSIPAVISLRFRPTHEITPELLVNDENNAFNFGGGLGYLQRNFLGDARLLNLSAKLQLQSFQLVTFSSKVLHDTVTVGRVEATAQLTQPYFFSNAMSLTWGVSSLVDKQQPYVQILLRNKISVSKRFATFTTGYLDWDVERAKVDSLQAIPLPQGLETPQFNSILTFTLQRDKTNDIFSPTKGFFNLMTIEEAGVLPNIINSIFKHSDFPYAQYWKFTLLGKWFFSLNENSTNVFALKANVGYAQEYGTYQQNQVGPIPLNHRFFAGGSGSIRGWRTHELGAVPFPQYGGNALIETNFEDRFPVVGNFGGVLFIDAGNLWNTYRQITLETVAVATGFGLRYNTFFGPLRVDFGFRLYDPSAPAGQQFLYQQSVSTLLRQVVVHFGIGQAF